MSKYILSEIRNGIQIITLNCPKKKNALNIEMLLELPSLLRKASANNEVKIVVISGKGDYFTSGNNLNNFSANKQKDGEIDFEEALKNGANMFSNLIKSLIDMSKPLVAVVNGPAVGVGVTMLGLCDIVLASDRATFHTPFIVLGQTPEGCSSYIFPKLMGHTKASEVLLFGRKLNAQEAYERNLVTEVIKHEDLDNVWAKLTNYSLLPINTLMNAKALIRTDKDILHKINERECEQLIRQWTSQDFMDAIMKFNKSKL